MTETAEELLAEAAQHEKNAVESFERCDTDGFLSQWASGINAEKARTKAKIVEAGGVATFCKTKLVKLDGSESGAKLCRTRYGLKWRIDATDQWLAYSPARESTLAKHGFKEVEIFEVAPAKVITWGPKGGGYTSVQVLTLRSDIEGNEAFDWGCIGAGNQLDDGASEAI